MRAKSGLYVITRFHLHCNLQQGVFRLLGRALRLSIRLTAGRLELSRLLHRAEVQRIQLCSLYMIGTAPIDGWGLLRESRAFNVRCWALSILFAQCKMGAFMTPDIRLQI